MKKHVRSSIIFMFITCGWGASSLAQEPPAPRGEMRIVDKSPLNWAWITHNTREHLIEFTKDGQLVPRLATDWRWLDDRTIEFTLRQGVTFHNGEVFDAEIVKLNWDEGLGQPQPSAGGTFMNFKPGSRMEILDPYTVRFIFPEPDGGALIRFANMHLGNRQYYRELGWKEKHW